MLATDGPYCPWVHTADDRPRPHRWSIPQRRLTHWLLVTSLDGEERIRVDGVDLHVPRGASYCIQPGVLADLGSERGNTPAWIHFDVAYDARRAAHPHVGPYQDDLAPRRTWLQPEARAAYGLALPVLVPAPLAPLFRSGIPHVVRTWREGGEVAQLQAAHLVAGLMLAWVAHARQERAGPSTLTPEARLARAEALARQHLSTDFDVDDFAAAAGYSRSRFCALWQRLRRESPGVWLRRERMRLAEQLLRRDDLPVARVGEMVGYRDATVFGRVFRAHAGTTPGEWRRRRS